MSPKKRVQRAFASRARGRGVRGRSQAPAQLSPRERSRSPAPARGTARSKSAAKNARGAGRGRGRARSRTGEGDRAAGAGGTAAELVPVDPGDESCEAPSQSPTAMRAGHVQSLLADPNSSLGSGASAVVLFHEGAYDSAMINLEANGAELAETNDGPFAILYFVVDAEDGEVEFELPGTVTRRRLSQASEVLIPSNAEYCLKNHSRTVPARLLAVVPRMPPVSAS